MKNIAFKGFFYTFLQQLGNQVIGFLVLIILSRSLEPRDFGLIGMIALIFTIGNVLIDSGLGKSLIRHPESDDYHFSVIFSYSVAIGFLLYFITFLIAPLIAYFYNEPQLQIIVRVLGISLIINSLSSIQQVYLMKKLQFKKLSYLSLVSSIVGAVAGISMAYCGFGIWSIVSTTLVTQIILMILLWIFSDWKPRRFIVDHKVFSLHFDFGYKLLLTNLIDAMSRNIYNVILGKKYNPNIVSYYYRSDSFRQVIVMTLITATNRVSYPLLSGIQNNKALFEQNYKKVILVLAFFITPILIYCYFFAEDIIVFLLTDKWKDMTIYFQLVSLSGLLYPLTSFNINALSVTGNSNMVLKLEIINKTILIVLALLASFFEIKILLLSYVLFGIIEYLVTISYTQKYINYKRGDQILDYLLPLLTSLVSGGISVFMIKMYSFNVFVELIISFSIFLGIYVLLNFKFKNQGLFYILNLVKKA